jgi:Mn2+/Fe2+ NRAMP family transporter
MVTEFIGMSAGLVVVGIPLAPAVLVSLLMVVAITLFTGYSTKERIALVLASLNGLFLVVAFLTHPDWSSIAKAICFLSGPSNTGGLPFYVFALLGNTLAPWMITFQCSAYIDKGVPSSHLGIGRLDTLTGSVVQAVVAASVLIVGATLAGHLPDVEHLGPSALLYGFGTFLGPVAATLFAMALFNAGLLASMTVSLSSSWSIAEIFGWARSLNDRIPEAPRFSSVYIGSQIIATVLLLTTNIPLNMISTLSQIVSGILLIPVVIFLVLLTNRESVLGSHKNGRVRRPIAFILAATLVVSVVALIVLCLLPDES